MHIVGAYVKPGDVVVDATCGNGKDTLALAAMNPARLYAFDVQGNAVRETVRLLEENGYGGRLISGCKGSSAGASDPGAVIIVEQLAHEDTGDYFRERLDDIPGADAPLKAVVFNLGYLPGGDKQITTKAETTLAAVRSAMELLAHDGLICLTMYSGHPEGREEKAALLRFAEELDEKTWHCAYISMTNQHSDPPEILLITRKK